MKKTEYKINTINRATSTKTSENRNTGFFNRFKGTEMGNVEILLKGRIFDMSRKPVEN